MEYIHVDNNLYCRTLQKIYSFVQNQVEKGLVKRIMNYKENASLLNECTAELEHAVNIFEVQ